MAINTFSEKVTAYIPVLDEIYQYTALTANLDDPALARQFIGANQIKLPKISTDGAGTYDRDNGYAQGGISVEYEAFTLGYDRGRKFRMDVIDNDEAGFDAFRTAAAEYVRTKEVPEIDAVRFAEIYAAATRANTKGTVASKDLTSSDSILTLFDTAEKTLNENQVPQEGRVFYCTNDVYGMLKSDSALQRRIDVQQNNGQINRSVTLLDGITPIVRVPKVRFNSLIQLLDGKTTGQTGGGYQTVTGNKPINFIYCLQRALHGVIKRHVTKIVTPEVNQTADSYDIFYRMHHDLIVRDNETAAIYVHTAATAQA